MSRPRLGGQVEGEFQVFHDRWVRNPMVLETIRDDLAEDSVTTGDQLPYGHCVQELLTEGGA